MQLNIILPSEAPPPQKKRRKLKGEMVWELQIADEYILNRTNESMWYIIIYSQNKNSLINLIFNSVECIQ